MKALKPMLGLMLSLSACAPPQSDSKSESEPQATSKSEPASAQASAVPHSGQALPSAQSISGKPSAKPASSAAPANTNWLHYYTVQTGRPIPMLPVPGLVAPLESNLWAVSPRIAGRIDSLRVMLGQSVGQGQRIALIRSTDFADLWRDLKIAREQESLRSQEVKNAQTLAEAHAISQKDLKEAEQSLREASLNRTATQEKLNALNVQAEGENAFWLTSPHGGVVVDVNVTTGQEVGPESPPLVKIAKLDQVLVTAQALEGDVEGLRPGQRAQVSMPGRSDQQVSAQILSVSQAVDPDQHTVPVRLLVSPAPRWMRPNSYVQISFSRQAGQILQVPSEAVVTDDLKSIVFVTNPKTHKLERRPVILGKQGKDMTEITGGLRAGEVIVSKGAILLLNEVDS